MSKGNPRIVVRFTPSELALLRTAAETRKLSASEVVRVAVRQFLGTVANGSGAERPPIDEYPFADVEVGLGFAFFDGTTDEEAQALACQAAQRHGRLFDVYHDGSQLRCRRTA